MGADKYSLSKKPKGTGEDGDGKSKQSQKLFHQGGKGPDSSIATRKREMWATAGGREVTQLFFVFR